MSRPAEDADRIGALIASLSKPDAYPHPVQAPVRVMQTHISIVFLTGEFAYKVKKPVDFGFLNFSTLDKRRHFCNEELRLNRKFAPELYLDVAPVYGAGNRFSLMPFAGAEIADYAVKMRQFRDEDLLLNRFHAGAVGMDEAIALAKLIARLHGEAPPSPDGPKFGAPAAIAKMIDRNLDILRAHRGGIASKDEIDRLHAFTARVLEERRGLFEARAAGGRIRECHGDLHLNNICVYGGKFELFDRIEFNEEFKQIDVIYDLAFLYMDLEFRGRRDLATLVFNTWIEETGDYEAAVLLRFYASSRAQIRAEVLSLSYDESETPDAARHEIGRTARKYVELALTYAETRTGRVFAMCGLPGSGKSTVARELATRVGAVHIRSDALRKHLAGAPLLERAPHLYTDDMTAQTYGELARLSVEIASAGMDVILDATYGQRAHREQLRGAVAETPTFLYCRGEQAEFEARLHARGPDVSDADVAVLRRHARQFEPPEGEPGVVAVDTAAGISVDFILPLN